MMRIFAGAFAALLLAVSPSWADLSADITTSAQANNGANSNLAGNVDTDAFRTEMQALIVAVQNAKGDAQVTSIESIDDYALARTVVEMVSNLPAAQALAIVRAAARGKPGAATEIIELVTEARPSLGVQIAAAVNCAVDSVGCNSVVLYIPEEHELIQDFSEEDPNQDASDS